MRKAKTASRARGPEALARVQRNALNALQAWEQELEKQLDVVRSQIESLSGPVQAAAPAAPKRGRKTAKKRGRKTAKKRGRRPGRPAKKAARKATKKTARRGRKAAKKTAKKKTVRRKARKTAKKKTARRPGRPRSRKTARKTAKKAGGRRKQTMIEAIVQLLKDKGHALRPVEIAKLITAEKRYPTKSKNVYNAVMTNLVRSNAVKKNAEGAYVPA